jgi:hypothetical protein
LEECAAFQLTIANALDQSIPFSLVSHSMYDSEWVYPVPVGSIVYGSTVSPIDVVPNLNYSVFDKLYNSNLTFFSTEIPRYSGSIDRIGRHSVGMGWNTCNNSQSISYIGYFLPNVTGIWGIRVWSQGSFALWIGNVSLANYTLGNAIIRSEIAKVSHAKVLLESRYYALRVVYGSDSCSGFSVSFSAPGTSNWTHSMTDIFFAPKQDDTSWNLTPLPQSTTISTSTVDSNTLDGGWKIFVYDSYDRYDLNNLANMVSRVKLTDSIVSLRNVTVDSCSPGTRMIIGYLKPNVTGIFGIRVWNEGQFRMWVGDASRTTFESTSPYFSSNSTGRFVKKLSLLSGQYYAVRILHSTDSGSCTAFSLEFADPLSTSWYSFKTSFVYSPQLNAAGWTWPRLTSTSPTSYQPSKLSLYNGLSFAIYSGYYTFQTDFTALTPRTGGLTARLSLGAMLKPLSCSNVETTISYGYLRPKISGIWGIKTINKGTFKLWIGLDAHDNFIDSMLAN